MTIPDEEHDRLYRTEREQSATIARLERELAEATRVVAVSEKFRDAFEAAKHKMYAVGGEIAEFAFANMPCGSGPLDRAAAAVMGHRVLADAEALRELAAWMVKTGNPVEYMYFRDGLFRVRLHSGAADCGIARTLAAAIMDAIKKAG